MLKKMIMAMLLCVSVAQAKTIKVNEAETCMLVGPIGEQTFIDLIACPYSIVLINSPGGNSDYIEPILDAVKGKTLVCIYCASAAGMILGAHRGEKYAVKTFYLMLHEAYHLVPAFGALKITLDDYKNICTKGRKDLIKTNKIISKMFKGISSREYVKRVAGKDWVVTYEEAMKYKFIDGIVELHITTVL